VVLLAYVYHECNMSTQTSIVAKKLTVKKGKSIILNELDFEVKKGLITGLIGPSGSGKTTLMRTIVGVQKLSGGELSVLGMSAGNKDLRHKIGYVTQSPAVYPDLTVVQNLRYFATLVHASIADVERILGEVQLESQRNQLTSSLSGGQKARVSLAVALLGEPEILILDEPTVGLDPVLREDLWQVFSKFAQQGKTILVSSHVMDEADRCDELLLLRDGLVLWNDSREKLIEQTKTRSVGEAFVAIIKSGEVK
jgi:ABC-2 type transport system ATP-binding protein